MQGIEDQEKLTLYYLTLNHRLANWSCGVVVITSASHAEGREFDPHQDLKFLFLFYL